jgi:2'-hydroxyisoflavone reductase
VDDKFLIEAGVGEWMELPLWLSEIAPDAPRGFMAFNCSKAIAHGLTFRPLADTVRDTLRWAQTLSQTPAPDSSYGPARPKAGMETEREAHVLKAWHAAQEDDADIADEIVVP